MRCPKCQYISFDHGERCRNCGYEFSLSVAHTAVDVTINREEPRPGRVDDVDFTALDAPLNRHAAGGDDRDLTARADQAAGAVPLDDLPLFSHRFADDQAPLVTPPAIPRQPLSVRRTNPAGRSRAQPPRPDEPGLDVGSEHAKNRLSAKEGRLERAEGDARGGRAAGVLRRVTAGAIDVAILAAIQAAVFYLTLRACELDMSQWRLLPLVPLGAFMLLLCGGYFVLFTAAGGQTPGKMATGIRVVSASAGDGPLRVSFGAAATRAVACLGSVLAIGAGFLPVLFTADRRAFHDRVAATRVVKA